MRKGIEKGEEVQSLHPLACARVLGGSAQVERALEDLEAQLRKLDRSADGGKKKKGRR